MEAKLTIQWQPRALTLPDISKKPTSKISANRKINSNDESSGYVTTTNGPKSKLTTTKSKSLGEKVDAKHSPNEKISHLRYYVSRILLDKVNIFKK